MIKKVQINSEGIENIINKNYEEAIVEYVLNAIEANATHVSIIIRNNELTGVEEIEVIDDGDGIDYETIDQTFGFVLSSQKEALLKPIDFGKNKGKGRFSFISFAHSAKWETVY